MSNGGRRNGTGAVPGRRLCGGRNAPHGRSVSSRRRSSVRSWRWRAASGRSGCPARTARVDRRAALAGHQSTQNQWAVVAVEGVVKQALERHVRPSHPQQMMSTTIASGTRKEHQSGSRLPRGCDVSVGLSAGLRSLGSEDTCGSRAEACPNDGLARQQKSFVRVQLTVTWWCHDAESADYPAAR